MVKFELPHLEEARAEMRKEGLKAYLVVTGDPHDSEEPAAYFASERRYFCPFTGDNAFVLLTEDGAYLWTDGRFFISAESELEGSSFKLMKMGTPGYPTLNEFLLENSLYPLGTDFNMISPAFLALLKRGGEVKDTSFAHLMESRPEFPSGKVYRFDDPKYNDLTRQQKFAKVMAAVKGAGGKAHLITTLDDIAYLTNLRGNDIPYTPVFYSYLYLDESGATLFIDKEKLDFEIEGVNVLPYEEIDNFLLARKDVPTLLDTNKANAHIVSLLANVVDGRMPSRLMKAVKGEKEIENTKAIQEIDGVALLKFIDFLDAHKEEKLTEWDYAEALAKFRRQGQRFLEESFMTIAASGSNAAMMHYAPTAEVNSVVDPENTVELLLDSGGQYLGGTTDTTRTFLVGKASDEFKHDYTLTLKSLIALSSAIFIRGSTGRCIDMTSRQIMWKEGLDYKCGTGHGVGYLSVVHESPNGFRYRAAAGKDDDAENVPGMITTIEPGVYKQGKYGIRIENNLLTVRAFVTDDGEFYKFETITYAPIDVSPLDLSLLSDEEIAWLNDYHDEVYRRLSKHVSGHLLEVLKAKTAPIHR